MEPNIPDAKREDLRSDRLRALMSCGPLHHTIGQIEIEALSLGSDEEWAHSAAIYLSCALTGTQGGTLGGEVKVSAAAVGLVLAYIEKLEIAQDIIPAPRGEA